MRRFHVDSRCVATFAALVLGGLSQARPAAAQFVVADLNPAGFRVSFAKGNAVGHQVGEIALPGSHAAMWSGTAASVVDLHPAGFDNSDAVRVSGGQQVGFGTPTGG